MMRLQRHGLISSSSSSSSISSRSSSRRRHAATVTAGRGWWQQPGARRRAATAVAAAAAAAAPALPACVSWLHSTNASCTLMAGEQAAGASSLVLRRQQRRHHHRRVVAAAAAAVSGEAAAAAAATSNGDSGGDVALPAYSWSWSPRSGLPEEHSPFDDAHAVPAAPTPQDVLALLKAAVAAGERSSSGSSSSSSSEGGGNNGDAAAADGSSAPAASAAAAAAPPSQAWLARLLGAAAASSALAPPALTAGAAAELLALLAQLDYTPASAALQPLLRAACDGAGGLGPRQLAGLAWSLSNLRAQPARPQWDALLAAARAQLQEFYGPDLAALVCALGALHAGSRGDLAFSGDDGSSAAAAPTDGGQHAGEEEDNNGDVDELKQRPSSPSPQLPLPPGWADAVAAEASFQLREFLGDLGAFDVARLASGLADLLNSSGGGGDGGGGPPPDLAAALLKAAYMRTRTIQEKGAVDFALAKLDAGGKRSMHFDPRWTHEELHWLPRRERDKRRILKEGWHRTKWGGWTS